MVITRNRNRGGSGSAATLRVAKLAKLGGDVPNRKTVVRIEDEIDIPTLSCSYCDKGLVASLPPSPDVLSSFFIRSPQCVRCVLVQAMKRVAVHVMSHFWLVDVASSSPLCIPEHLVCHLQQLEWHLIKPYIKNLNSWYPLYWWLSVQDTFASVHSFS